MQFYKNQKNFFKARKDIKEEPEDMEEDNEDENKNKNKNKEEQKNDIPSLEEKKCTLRICGQGDYPLIKIVDLRNSIISSSTLWRDFNVDEANKELQKELTQEEIYFAQSVGSKIENGRKN